MKVARSSGARAQAAQCQDMRHWKLRSAASLYILSEFCIHIAIISVRLAQLRLQWTVIPFFILKSRRDVLAGDPGIDSLNLTGELFCFVEQETGHVRKLQPGRHLKTGPKTTTNYSDP